MPERAQRCEVDIVGGLGVTGPRLSQLVKLPALNFLLSHNTSSEAQRLASAFHHGDRSLASAGGESPDV